MASSSEKLSSRRSAQGIDATIFPECFPEPCDVYELYGDEGCGKSEMLLHLVVRAIVLPEWKGARLNGLGIGVVYIDTDYKFCMLRLSTLLESFIRKSLTDTKCEDATSLEENDLEAIVKVSLRNFWLVRCGTSEQLLMTVHSLDNFIKPKQDVAVLMLDSISSFYWIDKLKCGDNRKMLEQSQGRLVSALEKLVTSYNLVLFVTKSALIRKRNENLGNISPVSPGFSTNQSKSSEHLELLSSEWTKFVKYRWILSKIDKETDSSVETFGIKSGSHSLTFTDKINVLGAIPFKISQYGVNFNPLKSSKDPSTAKEGAL